MTSTMIEHDSSSQPEPSMAPDELILLMGGPGSGKGTTGHVLAHRLGAELRSTGQLLREQHDPRISYFLDRGDLVPEADLERTLTSAVHSLKGKPLILDGATKKPREAQWLLGKLNEFERRLPVVIFLEVDEALARRRIQDGDRGRPEDAPEYQEHRWREFRAETLQSIEVYRQAGLLEILSSDRPVDELVEHMLNVISRRQAASAVR